MKWSVGPAVLFLAACAEINAAREAQDPSSAGPGERTATARELGLAPGSTLAYERGLEISLTHNPAIATSRSRVEAARARVGQSRAGFFPSISTSANIRGNQSGGGGEPTADVDDSQGGSISASQLLFDFGKTSATIRQSAENLLAAELDLVIALNDLSFDFRQAYFSVLKNQELVAVNQETVRQFEKRLEQVKGFVEVGTRAKYDLTKAQVDLGNAQLNLVRAQTQLRNSRATLNKTLGLAEEAAFALVKPEPETGGAQEFNELLEFARKNHPQLQALAYRERAAVAAIDAAIADLYPQFSFSASFSYSGTLTPVGWSWVVGPIVNWLVFSGWSKTEALKERVASLKESRANRANAEQQIYLDLSQSSSGLQDARERLRISRLTVQSAQENLELVQGRFTVGRASSVELTDAQVALANARGEFVQAEFDLQIALAALKRAMGTR